MSEAEQGTVSNTSMFCLGTVTILNKTKILQSNNRQQKGKLPRQNRLVDLKITEVGAMGFCYSGKNCKNLSFAFMNPQKPKATLKRQGQSSQ